MNNSRQESYLWGGYIFDVELAKKLAEGYDSHLVPSHRSIGGMKLSLPKEEYDLGNPVIFCSWINEQREVGILLIDGNHRMQWAAKHHLNLEIVILNPIDTWSVMGEWVPKWNKRQWQKLTAAARFYQVSF